MRIIILCLLFFMGIAVWADAKFVLFQLTGISGRKKISTHRTLFDCLESGKKFQSIECTQVWKKTKPSKSETIDEAVRNHIMKVCNQEGK